MSCSIEHERSFITSGPGPMLKVGNAVTVLFRWLDAHFVAFKMAPNIKKHSLYVSSYRRLYKGHSCVLRIF